MNVHELREINHQVRIRHHRVFNGIGVLVPDSLAYDIDNVLTRGEFEQAKADQNVEYDARGANLPQYQQYKFPEDVPYGKAVMPTGGFCTVEVTTPNGTVVVGKRNFGKNEPFNRKIGVKAALNQALKKLESVVE